MFVKTFDYFLLVRVVFLAGVHHPSSDHMWKDVHPFHFLHFAKLLYWEIYYIFSSICSSNSALFTRTCSPHRCFTEPQSLTPNQATEKLPFNRRKPWTGPRSGRFALFTPECASEDSFIVWCLLFLRKLQHGCSVLTEISTHSFFGMIRMWLVPRGDVATGRCLCFIMEEAKLNQKGHRNLTPPPCYSGPPPVPCNVLLSSR